MSFFVMMGLFDHCWKFARIGQLGARKAEDGVFIYPRRNSPRLFTRHNIR
jgi:hypothetical protein